MEEDKLPPGWDKDRVREVLAHYEAQSEDEAAAEDEPAAGSNGSRGTIPGHP